MTFNWKAVVVFLAVEVCTTWVARNYVRMALVSAGHLSQSTGVLACLYGFGCVGAIAAAVVMGLFAMGVLVIGHSAVFDVRPPKASQ